MNFVPKPVCRVFAAYSCSACSSQASRAAGASRVMAWAGSPPGESWKREERGGQGRVHGGSRGG